MRYIDTPQKQRPVLWEVVGTTVTEHVLADGYCATGVNELQQFVGESEGYGQGFGVNARGDVRGEFGFVGSTEGYSAVRDWNGGSLEILGQLNERQADDRNWAVSINDAEQAVGCDVYTTRSGGWKHTGVLWQIDGSAKDLLGFVNGWYSIGEAMGINNRAMIAALGRFAPYGAARALVMIPPQ